MFSGIGAGAGGSVVVAESVMRIPRTSQQTGKAFPSAKKVAAPLAKRAKQSRSVALSPREQNA
jgi:hypothetical protein